MTGCDQGAEVFATALFAGEFNIDYGFFFISVLSFSFFLFFYFFIFMILCVISKIWLPL